MTHHIERTVLPFTAIVGQENLKRALVLNAINPNLNGVLIKGEKGTAKSTAVRALAEVLPEVDVVENCPFNCHPGNPALQCDVCNERYEDEEDLPVQRREMRVVDLPLGATEDRVVGTLDLERALDEGIKALEPGILADVNQGILYVDEVNLLDDHLVDSLLDAAAMGINVIEREGISLAHPSKFILVGTMNPEEGEVRPQLLDRFGLQVDVEGIKDVGKRAEIVRRVEEFEESPDLFSKKWSEEQEKLRERIEGGREILEDVEMSEWLLKEIADLCAELDVDGHRADILIARTAKTLAAYRGRRKVTADDVREAAELVLPHRIKKRPFEEPELPKEMIENLGKNEERKGSKNERNEEGPRGDGKRETGRGQDEERERTPGGEERTFGIEETGRAEIRRMKDGKERIGSGRRAKTLAKKRGRYVKSRIPNEDSDDIAVDACLRASAARSGEIDVKEQDLREKVRERRKSSVIAFVVDASGSMAAARRMEVAKGAVLSLLTDSHQRRDKVAFVAFRGDGAEVLLEPTSSVEAAAKKLRELPTGRRTPLPSGMHEGMKILERELRKDENVIPIMVLVSDGRGNVPINEDVRTEVLSIAEELRKRGVHLLVIDTERGPATVGYNEEIAEASGGQYTPVEELSPEGIAEEVRPFIAAD